MLSRLDSRYRVRPARLDDVEAVCALRNAQSMRTRGTATYAASEQRVDWQIPGFNLETDTRLVRDGDGSLVGFASVWDAEHPHVAVHGSLCVHPDRDDPGIEEALLDWIEERARQAIDHAPADARVWLSLGAASTEENRKALLLRRGFELVRHFVRLRIEMSGPPDVLPLPPGIAIRPFDPVADLRPTVLAVRETFRDHWGHVEGDLEQEAVQWAHWVREDPDFDPSVWHLACDGGEIVGISLGTTVRPEAKNLAYIFTFGVRKAWRGRGIARALLSHSFATFYERGRPVVDLDADAANLTGAIRLYTGLGMHTAWQDDAFEKELRPGVDLARRRLEEG